MCVCMHGDHDPLGGSAGGDAVIVGWFISSFCPEGFAGIGWDGFTYVCLGGLSRLLHSCGIVRYCQLVVLRQVLCLVRGGYSPSC
jgi:hypothetical protein